MQKLPIPSTNWTETDGYVLMLLCCPADPAWIGTVRGRIYELATGRLWDEKTGWVKDAQIIGEAIWQSMATCKLDDLVAAVQSINITLASLSENSVSEKVAFELARVNYNLDRIRDNLDSFAPDGEETIEYGLATILAALGPNVTRSTEFIKAIKDALNTNLIGFPDETGEFAEGTSPALADMAGEITSFSAALLPGGIMRLEFDVTGDTQVLVEVQKLYRTYNLNTTIETPRVTLTLHPDQFPGVTGGVVTAIDQKFNVFTDSL